MHHRRHEKLERVLAQRQRFALLGYNGTIADVKGEELRDHRQRFGAGHDLHIRILFRQRLNVAGVVRLHMGNDEIIRLSIAEHVCKGFQPRAGRARVYGIHHSDLFV